MSTELRYQRPGVQLYHGDARVLPLADESVHLVVTSPPYNARVRYDVYDDWLPWDEYWQRLIEPSLRECYRVLAPGGRLCVNFANVVRQNVPEGKESGPDWTYTGHWRWTPPGAKGTPWAALVDEHLWPLLRTIGFLPRERISWVKGDSEEDVTTTSTAWGSWRSPSNPVLRATAEPVFVASKTSYARAPGESDLTSEEFKCWTRNTWFIPVRKIETGHPAQFPLELPRRLIKLYSYVGDTVLDPFCGSGTTLRAALDCGREAIGVEISDRYCRLAAARCGQLSLGMEATA